MRPAIAVWLGGMFVGACSADIAGNPSAAAGAGGAEVGASGGEAGALADGSGVGASSGQGGSEDGATLDASPPEAAASDAGGPQGCAHLLDDARPESEWVHVGTDGKLAYKPLGPKGDRIMDFSYAGYRGGGVALPDMPVKETVSPSGADDTAAINDAIVRVSKLPLTDGIR